MVQSRKRVLSGIQPSGTLHLGNYFGMMKPALELQESGHECFYFIADYHALTQRPEPSQLRARSFGVAVDFLACGLDPARTTFFRQSDVPEVHELTWVLSCLTPVGLLERCHSYKDKLARGLEANHGLFSYPVLMAADILIYGSHLVPVGKDQKQHLEVTRDLAIRFNNAYGDILVVPDAMIREEVAVVPGLDGQKMSKSYDNTIEIFGEPKPTRQKIMRIVTDSTPMEAPKDPEKCTVFALFKLLASEAETAELRQRYLAGGMGYGHAKQALADTYAQYFEAMRERRLELVAHPERVEAVLQAGAARARAAAREMLERVRTAVGMGG
jgi:tryptophanyl-tRNA synthetase